MSQNSQKPSVQQFYFDQDLGQRLDNFLFSRLKGVPKSHVYKMIRQGEIRINKKRADAKNVLQKGDIIRVAPVRMAQKNQIDAHGSHAPIDPDRITSSKLSKIAHFPPLPVLFEDEDLLIVNKPHGVAVHGGSGIQFGVIEYLRQTRTDLSFLELVHRLDKETSGILILAKKRSALLNIQKQIQQQQCKKRYVALVWGQWVGKDWQRLDVSLKKYTQADGGRFVRVESSGQASLTLAKCVNHAFLPTMQAKLSLLDIQLKTGRTHQIRVHLAHHGFQIVGDEKYGDFQKNKLLEKHQTQTSWCVEFLDTSLEHTKKTLIYQKKRMFLHAYAISFHHPRTQMTIELRTHTNLMEVFRN